MNKILSGALAAGALACAATSFSQTFSPADLNAPWSRSCSAALGERVRKEHPGATKVEIITDTLQQWAESNTQTGFQGDGQFLLANDWVPFQFRCVYNTASRRVDHLSHSVKAATGEAGPVRSKTNADAFTSKACSAEVSRKILAERPRARVQMFADAFQSWKASESETGVGGRGEALGPDGSRQEFAFECLCGLRTNRVTRAVLRWAW